MSNVYLSRFSGKHKSWLTKTEELFERAGFASLISPGDIVAIKVHFGERGNTAFLSPLYVRRIVDKVKAAGGKPFITDANTLYVGTRSNAVDHLTTALENGFGYATVGAPLVIADGLNGKDYVAVEIDGKHFKEAKLGSAVVHANAMIVLTHFKGHELTGFGGALKNVGMGLGCRSAKQMMHSDVLPEVDEETCTACGDCVDWCPTGAIAVDDAARIDPATCIGCGECTVTCSFGAIMVNWKTEPQTIQEKIVEYTWAAVKDKPGKVGYVNFVMDVSPDCDCWGWNDTPIVPDIGIAASLDPIAIDQACADLVNDTLGIAGRLERVDDPDKFGHISGIDWRPQLAYGEEIGLGTRAYNLVTIE